MSRTLFHTALYAALALVALGLLWRMSAWFRVRIGPDARTVTPAQRVGALFLGAASALFSRRLLNLIPALFLDVLLQRRLYANDKLRWLGHLLMFFGFMLLLLLHALAPIVTVPLFQGYESTLAPWLFLRNLCGAMVLIGIALFLYGVWRRRTRFAPVRGPMAAAFVALLGFVLITGFLLEADKIASPRAFHRMAQENGVTDPAELEPLRALWAAEYGVAFGDLRQPLAPELLEKGRIVHAEGCESCHARPQSAFVSYPIARALAPVAGALDAARAEVWLLYLHVFACFIGLATLPFTRFYHAVAAPVSLLVDAAAPRRGFSAAARASRRALALDACVRCGLCDTDCSVAPLARHLGNPTLLPSHKLIATGALAGGSLLAAGHEHDALRAAEGAFLCTDCGRCTSACPVGLDLEDLWQAGRGDLAAANLTAAAQWVRARPASAWAELLRAGPSALDASDADGVLAPLSANRDSFSRCVQCQTCTNVCPVVAHSTDPGCGVDLTPQKVMNLLRLGMRDLTLGSRMVWDCATCYQCQEHCPEGIRVADIMVELRALAVHRLGAVRNWKAPS
ncbi:MAG: 4Fe-4S dicluster domain-containing protein [Burkholderiales bacterium]|nr:4Fe-4S dicluster domain-containing protein [Burkholderiales bacterium]